MYEYKATFVNLFICHFPYVFISYLSDVTRWCAKLISLSVISHMSVSLICQMSPDDVQSLSHYLSFPICIYLLFVRCHQMMCKASTI